MATIIVPANGASVSGVTFNDVLQADPSVDLNASSIYYNVDGNSTVQSLYIGYAIEVDVGLFSAATLTGTGNITGPTDQSMGLLPQLYIESGAMLDVNGTISTALTSDGTITVSSGEKLNLTGDLFSDGTISVAANGELDLNNPTAAFITQMTVNGTVKSSAKQATLQTVANAGTIDVIAGTLSLTTSVTGSGSLIVENGATLDLSMAQNVSGTVILEAGSKLEVAPTTNFTGTIQNPASNASIELIGITATGATVSNGKIVITTSAGATYSLGETGLTNGTALSVSTDISNGTLLGSVISLSTSTPTPTPTPTPGGTGSTPGTSTPAPVYRFFDLVHGTHFFTADINERNSTTAMTTAYTEETNGFGAVAQSDPNAVAVYRFFDTKFGTHFFTANAAERDTVRATRSDLSYEPASTFYEHATQQTGDVAVYRLFDQSSGTHFYTGDQNEYNKITTPGTFDYRADLKPEGIEFYAPTGSFA